MRLSNKVALILGFTSLTVFSNEYTPPLDNIEVINTKLSTLSIQNLSSEKVEIDIYSESLVLEPASGIKFDCKSYDNLELIIKNNIHDYFEIPCQSRVTFTENFYNEIKQGN